MIDYSNAQYMKTNTEILLLWPISLNREVIIKGVIFEGALCTFCTQGEYCLPQWPSENRAKTAQREKCGPRERGRKFKHRAERSQCGRGFCSLFSSFSIQFLSLLSAVLERWKISALRATETGSSEYR